MDICCPLCASSFEVCVRQCLVHITSLKRKRKADIVEIRKKTNCKNEEDKKRTRKRKGKGEEEDWKRKFSNDSYRTEGSSFAVDEHYL